MEKNFKVGDRVRHPNYGEGTVEYVSLDGMRCYVTKDNMGEGVINVSSDDLKLIEPAPTAAPTPDRAMIAAMAMQGLLAGGGMFEVEIIAKDAVDLADALIAELKKPKQ